MEHIEGEKEGVKLVKQLSFSPDPFYEGFGFVQVTCRWVLNFENQGVVWWDLDFETVLLDVVDGVACEE